MAINHNSRMVGISPEDKVSAEQKKEFVNEISSELDKEIDVAEKEAAAEKEDASKIRNEEVDKFNKEVEELSKKLDLDNFFFTGDIDHTFKIGGKATVTLKVLTSQELQETQAFLWALRNEDMSGIEAEMKYAVEVLSYAMTQYGKKKFDKVERAERKEFLSQLPSMVIPIIFNKYSMLEKAATMAIRDGAVLKN